MPSHVTLAVPDKDDYSPTGVLSNPLRVDPTGTTVQPVSFSGGISVTAIQSGTTVGISGQPISTTLAAGTTVGVTGTTAVSGTVTTAPPANASTNLTQVAGTTLGATAVTNYGTAPAAAAVPGVNAFVTNTVAVSGSALTTTIASQPIGVSGTVTVTSGTATNLLGKMDVVGNAGADAVITAATAPANGLAVLAVQNTTAPSLTTGQSVALQCDYEGSLFVKPYRRAQTVAKATTIAVTTATTILAAQAAGIFADISALVITTTPAASTSIAFTSTISDGTNSFIYDMETGALATSPADRTSIELFFDPPLPATTAATAWTQTNSVSTATTHTTICAVLQKAG